MEGFRPTLLRLASLLLFPLLAGCLGPVALHQAVLGYDETISRLDREMLLLNIARKHNDLPSHFTVTSSIAATFDFRTQIGVTGTLAFPRSDSMGLSLGSSVAENPTLSIVPIQGEEFTKRVLTPMDERKFEFLLIQGARFDMVTRLMARGLEIRNRDGAFQGFILNSPDKTEEYKEFRRRVLHWAWLNEQRKLFVSRITFEESLGMKLSKPPPAMDLIKARKMGYRLRPVGNSAGKNATYELRRKVVGRVLVSNYDPRTFSNAERAELNRLANSRPESFVLVDIRPGRPGGDYSFFGAIKLRSLNLITQFLGDEVERIPEFDVEKDPRTGKVDSNPRRTLAIRVAGGPPPSHIAQALFRDRHYFVGDTRWDKRAFILLYQLFQMTLTDVSGAFAPTITISK